MSVDCVQTTAVRAAGPPGAPRQGLVSTGRAARSAGQDSNHRGFRKQPLSDTTRHLLRLHRYVRLTLMQISKMLNPKIRVAILF